MLLLPDRYFVVFFDVSSVLATVKRQPTSVWEVPVGLPGIEVGRLHNTMKYQGSRA